MNHRVIYKAAPNMMLRRVKQLENGLYLLSGDLCDKVNMSQIILYDLVHNRVIAK